MLRGTIWKGVRIAVFAIAVCLAFGSVAFGQSYGRYEDDHYYNGHDEAREHGYDNGYRDGLRAGRSDSDRGRRFKFKTDDWEDAHGFEHWMGNHGQYKRAYRDGYERGYRQAYTSYGDRRGQDRDRDDYRGHDRDDWR